jgi:ribosomal protein S20
LVASLLDRAVSKGVLHKNTAARKKQRLHKVLAGTEK